jgi:hypothetical protein
MKTVLKNTIAIAMPINEAQKLKCEKRRRIQNIILSILVISSMLTSCKMSRDTATICPPPVESVKPPTIQFAPANISGVVTDREGNILTDVAVSFDNVAIATTDANGKFSHTASKQIDKNYTITFSKEGYNNTSKSYHTSMGAADYTVQMGKPCKCDSIIIDNFCSCVQNVSFDWTNNTISENQETFNNIIQCLKQNPDCNITIEYQIADTKRAAPERVAAIKKYFVKKGITEGRMTTLTTSNITDDTNKVIIYKQ